MLVREIRCRSVLTRCGISSVDYAINPYVGCQHGCLYCYAVFMKRFTGHLEEWGQFVDVRMNAAEVLAKQLRRARPGSVCLGTVTDGYQPLERKYRLARQCLESLLPYTAFTTTVLTKSALVLRDLDVLRQTPSFEVAFTVTTLDDSVRRAVEPQASPIVDRLSALAQLHEAGIHTWAFFGPVLPGLSDTPEAIDSLFSALAETGISYVLVDTLNLQGAQGAKLRGMFETTYPHLIPAYRSLQQDRPGYARALAERVARVAQRYNQAYELAF